MKLIIGTSNGSEIEINDPKITIEDMSEKMLSFAVINIGNILIRSDCIEYVIIDNIDNGEN